ncbi:neprosin family prolyl endopeptidase [Branchiibius cervicis]|uniref:Neprosin family prolyl endopeptidase n=1 Tax=Branchiibius cervicis TaxID=908252 RepID=A0ABW2AVG8_9MICO
MLRLRRRPAGDQRDQRADRDGDRRPRGQSIRGGVRRAHPAGVGPTERRPDVDCRDRLDRRPSLNGDAHAHLFVYHWVNGQESCYNGCGFVQVSKWIKPGMRVLPGVGQFAIRNVNGSWWVYFDYQPVGYFPGSLWNGTYTKAQLISAFGEVAEIGSDSPSCTDMGDGRLGSKSFSSFIAGYRLEGSTDTPNLAVRATSPSQYDFGAVSPTSFRLGGPGTGRCAAPASATS